MKLTKKDWEKINNTIRELGIDRDSRQINQFRFANESRQHRRMKFNVCQKLYEEGKPFLCEAWANNRKQKFDIVDLLDGEVIEIDHTSKPKREQDRVTRISVEPQSKYDH